jgi:trehalose synthase-fused probable maltokinase
VLDGADPQPSIQSLARLGETTAALHLALGQPGGGPDFDPELIDDADVEAWQADVRAEVEQALHGLRAHGQTIDPGPLLARADGIRALRGAPKTRHHGDYHLGQVLETMDGNFAIIDFEGEPSKPLSVRRAKRSPLRDVAGMLRSFDYARHAALRAGDADAAQRRARADAWYVAARQAFLDAYLPIVGRDPAEVEAPLAALELEKAAYEVLYELNNRPDWLAIPVQALSS